MQHLTRVAALLATLVLPVACSYDSNPTNRPVARVVALLKDMQRQTEKEAATDQEIYDKMECWCDTNEKEKTKSIKEAETKIERLATQIEALTAESVRLNEKIKKIEEEVVKNQESLDKATAIRQEGLASFQGEDKDLLESISALKAAIVVLQKHNEAGGFLQVPRNAQNTFGKVRKEIQKNLFRFTDVLTPSERKIAMSFLQDYFDASPTFKSAYAPQSGEIFGILKQMLDTFERDLSAAQAEELAAAKAFGELKDAKEKEIAAGNEQIERFSQELADADEALAQAKQDIEQTQKALEADKKFLAMLQEKCAMTDKEWEERQKTRAIELEGIAKLIAMLSSDEARDLFTKTYNPSFVQSSSLTKSTARARASKVLEAAANKVHNPRLSALAVEVRLDAFAKVKAAIDDMVNKLLKEEADEVKQKDFCEAEFDSNELQKDAKQRQKEDLQARMAKLEHQIKQLDENIKLLNEEIEEMKFQMKRASENREKENKDFQETVADQRASRKLLNAALKWLQEFYGSQTKATLLQEEPAGPPPPAGFEAYNYKKMDGVMGLIREIIKDTNTMEAEAIRSESDAQQVYESFVKSTNDSIDAKTREMVTKKELKAKAEEALIQATKDHESTVKELEQLAEYRAELHRACDFILKNFDIRQTARDEEVRALRKAKEILSGAQFSEFLQTA